MILSESARAVPPRTVKARKARKRKDVLRIISHLRLGLRNLSSIDIWEDLLKLHVSARLLPFWNKGGFAKWFPEKM